MSNIPGRPGSTHFPPSPALSDRQTGYPATYTSIQQPPLQHGYPTSLSYPATTPSLSHKQPDMVTLPPPPHVQQQIMYRQQYEDHYGPPQQAAPPMGYPPQQTPAPHHHQQQAPQQQVPFTQPAPRQRTAIACRYCRRRKIRCYGFDTNPDGRCQNCARFNQECVFTPVSSQTHAFVPAHTAYPQLRTQGRYPPAQPERGPYQQPGAPGPPIYGPQGQPLSAVPPPPHGEQHPHYPAPPAGPHQPYAAPNPYPSMPPSGPAYEASRPPMQPPQNSHDQRRTSYDHEHRNQIPPISPSTQGAYPSQSYPGTGYYSQQQDAARRTSPTTGYSYDAGRSAGSPHSSAAGPPAQASYPYGGLHPPQVLPMSSDPRGPSPNGQNRDNRAGTMSVANILGDTQGSRSTTDSSMLSRLNQRAP